MARPSTVEFLKTESGAGLLLAAAALAAVIVANSPASGEYFAFVGAPLEVRLGRFAQTFTLAEWVKSGLMAVFFLVVGLEIKFEVLRGELSSPRRLALPLLAALGGMIAPAAVFLLCNLGAGGAPGAWPIPVATDIAFALAGLAVFARRLAPALRIFLLTLAIADDLGAVAIIAVRFTRNLDVGAAAGAGVCLLGLALLSRWRRAPFTLYAAGFLLVWALTLRAGVNTSLAGVACAMTVPIGARRADQEGVLKRFMDALHPYVAYLVLPLFAFTAAGFSWRALSLPRILDPLPVGIVLGLLVGKPVGVFGFAALAARLRLGRRPSGVTWPQIAGVSLLCGAGFTMSLYIGALAFPPGDLSSAGQVRLAVIVASVASVLAAGALLSLAARPAADDIEA